MIVTRQNRRQNCARIGRPPEQGVLATTKKFLQSTSFSSTTVCCFWCCHKTNNNKINSKTKVQLFRHFGMQKSREEEEQFQSRVGYFIYFNAFPGTCDRIYSLTRSPARGEVGFSFTMSQGHDLFLYNSFKDHLLIPAQRHNKARGIWGISGVLCRKKKRNFTVRMASALICYSSDLLSIIREWKE